MEIFLVLLYKLIPLYILMALGYVGGKFLKLQRESIANLLIYLIVPVVVFNGVYTTQLTPALLALPVIFYVVGVTVSILMTRLTRNVWKDEVRALFSYVAGTGNTGYFAIPVLYALYGETGVNISIIINLAFIFYENTYGYYIMARGNFTPRQSLQKLIRLPAIYAFFLGLICNISGLHLGALYTDFAAQFRGAYLILGMMILGLGIAAHDKTWSIDKKLIAYSYFTKFIIWPAIGLVLVYLDETIFHLYEPIIHHIVLVMCSVPLAANTVIFATQLKVQPEKAATAVFLSTVFAVFYVPLIVVLFT
ncbi:AEC family transporter [Candidatus Gracilibacteria bacterium]|nr:AEC family transporter [Candidatus Gracilibacteria bacterium]